MRLRTSPQYAPEITLGPEGWRPAPGERRIALLAPPGTYTVKLTVEGKEYTQPLKVLKDPHSNGTEGDIQIQMKMMTSLSGTMNGVVDAVNQLETLPAQLGDLKSALGASEELTTGQAAASKLD